MEVDLKDCAVFSKNSSAAYFCLSSHSLYPCVSLAWNGYFRRHLKPEI